MNNVSEKKKDSVLKTLAVAGFIGIIIIIAWLSVQLVHIVPSAFSSLASLAQSINQDRVEQTGTKVATLNVSSDRTLINNGETVTVMWDTASKAGSYTFAYQCADGIAVDLVNVDGLQSIACETNYNIGRVDSVTLTVDSEKDRYADLRYTVSFLATNDTEPRASGIASLTIINTDIQNLLATSESDDTTDEAESDSTSETTPTTAHPDTPATTYQQTFTFAVPTSDPNGRTDLSVRYLSSGTIVNDTFFTGGIVSGEAGAIQFEIKNYGTKTSKEWNYIITLPGGNEYTSPDQQPLKPNERAILTLGFPEAVGSGHTFTVHIDEPTDRNALNDSFMQNVNFVR
ncbi:hypothetical protein KC906_04845 [Candidatus Kaiserbacteria bacterium]|nr:hypothetical protein [Candidatus Kaiserbacteria bacterium]MCB9812639.1 hypothetical protein [Candidatus Nomurabacteria bacterium]